MKNNVAYKLAASSLVLGLTMIGCTPASTSYRPTAGATGSCARCTARWTERRRSGQRDERGGEPGAVLPQETRRRGDVKPSPCAAARRTGC